MVPIVGHEEHVHVFEIGLRVAPLQLREPRPGKDETVEDHRRIFQPLFDTLDPFVKANLVAGGAFVSKTVGLDEGDVLFPLEKHPQNEIGVEVARLEETHSFASTHIPE